MMRRTVAYALVGSLAFALPAFGQGDATAPEGLDASHPIPVSDAIPGKDGVKREVVLRALDKITGRAQYVYAPAGIPVKYATLTITSHYCYSTPPIEMPETTAYIDIVDHRPDQPVKKVFSGWMLASSPSLDGMQHPIYDVWVISCITNQPGQVAPTIASTAPVKVLSPDTNSKEKLPDLPEDSGQ